MPSVKFTRRLWALGIFVLPVVAVKVAAIMMGSDAPQSASATPAENPPIGPSSRPAVVKWSERQLAAAAHIASTHGASFGANPFLYVEEPKPVIEDKPVIPVEIVPQEQEPDATFTLNAVMSGSRGRTALIDGRPYREGDRIKDAPWAVQAIDCDQRQVTLFNAARQRTVVIRVETPLLSLDQSGTSSN